MLLHVCIVEQLAIGLRLFVAKFKVRVNKGSFPTFIAIYIQRYIIIIIMYNIIEYIERHAPPPPPLCFLAAYSTECCLNICSSGTL